MHPRHITLTALFILSLLPVAAGRQDSTYELSPAYRKWLNEDVCWIISSEERKEFRQLVTDDQRDKFIADFWERRNPNPGSRENSFKHAHYRRLAFSNEHFAAGIAGSKTDRGRIYVVYGPPDSVETNSESSNDELYPHENWFYKYLDGVGDNISLEFVDDCRCGAYELRKAPKAMF